MSFLIASLLAGIAFRLMPEASTEAAILLGVAVVLFVSEVPSGLRGRLKR